MRPHDVAPVLDDAAIEEVLTHGSLQVEGRLVNASNASFLGYVELDSVVLPCIYKPVAGERPLWDFPDGTLAGRERAARVVSEAAGWHIVPPTVLRDGRFGPGMCQRWVEVDAGQQPLVDVVSADADMPGWLTVLEAEDQSGDQVLLVHADRPELRSMAVFDVVINNADRKGGHVLVDETGSLWGCDHGVTLHAEPKLRTVLWGWAGEPLRDEDTVAVTRVVDGLSGHLGEQLAEWLTAGELEAIADRCRSLLRRARMPLPAGSWRVIPWPPF
jgi:uncharacterized repeat protein (TIGR03843 family)